MSIWRHTSGMTHPAAQHTVPLNHSEPHPSHPVHRTRLAAAWVGICIAALMLVALVFFVAQNTARVQISFLWLRGMVPLAVALLIASASGAVVVVILGMARIIQLRRVVRRHNQD